MVNLKEEGASLDFLGFTFRYYDSLDGSGRRYLNMSPSAKALKKERAKRTEQRATPVELHHATAPETSLQNLLGPAKSSLIVNINTASAQELESLPSIGSSRAEQIIAHRPYTSVDELSRVKGVTPRVIDQLRPFVKTDGATEKIK